MKTLTSPRLAFVVAGALALGSLAPAMQPQAEPAPGPSSPVHGAAPATSADQPEPAAPASPESPSPPAPADTRFDWIAPDAGADGPMVVPPGPPDTFTSRSCAGMMATIIEQAILVPEQDFIGRLSDAGSWLSAPEIKSIFPTARRHFRVPVPSTPMYVADDGAGNVITVVAPRADESLIRAILGQTLRLEPIKDAPELPEGFFVYDAVREDLRGGTLFIGPGPARFGEGAIMVAFVADPNPTGQPIDPETGAPRPVPPPTVSVREDGSLQLSTGAIIRGRGTAQAPYDISWDLLVSAERVYQPRNGLNRLPEWADILDDKYVRLTGHLLSPLMMDDTDQILLMRNQWDGCCIGVPPTPYDAVEVVLSRRVSLVREQLNFGTITGVLQVDPYLVNNWLVGLYILDGSRLENAGAQNWASPTGTPN